MGDERGYNGDILNNFWRLEDRLNAQFTQSLNDAITTLTNAEARNWEEHRREHKRQTDDLDKQIGPVVTAYRRDVRATWVKEAPLSQLVRALSLRGRDQLPSLIAKHPRVIGGLILAALAMLGWAQVDDLVGKLP